MISGYLTFNKNSSKKLTIIKCYIIIKIVLTLIRIQYFYLHLFSLSLVKNCKGHETYLAHKLKSKPSMVSYMPVNDDTHESETKTLLHTYALFPLALWSSRSGCCVCSGFSSQVKNHMLRKSSFL